MPAPRAAADGPTALGDIDTMLPHTIRCLGERAVASFVASNCGVLCLRLRTVNTRRAWMDWAGTV
jgi:hypothetical protein